MTNVNYLIAKAKILKTGLTNVCKYRCVMYYTPHLRHPHALIEEDLLLRIVDQCLETGIEQLSLGASY